jgi:hypothetical protein
LADGRVLFIARNDDDAATIDNAFPVNINGEHRAESTPVAGASVRVPDEMSEPPKPSTIADYIRCGVATGFNHCRAEVLRLNATGADAIGYAVKWGDTIFYSTFRSTKHPQNFLDDWSTEDRPAVSVRIHLCSPDTSLAAIKGGTNDCA